MEKENISEKYIQFTQKYSKKLNLKTNIELILSGSEGVSYDFRRNDTSYLYVPKEVTNRNLSVIIHYLGHTKMYEDGFPTLSASYKLTDDFLKTNPLSQKKFQELKEKNFRETFFGIANRLADTFEDFYVWIYLQEAVGGSYFKTYSSFINDFSLSWIKKYYENVFKGLKIKHLTYANSFDYFVSFYVLSSIFKETKQKNKVDKIFHELFKNSPDFTFPFAKERLEWARDFLFKTHEAFPNHKALLKSGKHESKFETYVRTAWKGTGFEPDKIHFSY